MSKLNLSDSMEVLNMATEEAVYEITSKHGGFHYNNGTGNIKCWMLEKQNGSELFNNKSSLMKSFNSQYDPERDNIKYLLIFPPKACIKNSTQLFYRAAVVFN